MINITYYMLGAEHSRDIDISDFRDYINEWSENLLCSINILGHPYGNNDIYLVEFIHENEGSYGINIIDASHDDNTDIVKELIEGGAVYI